MARKTSRKVVFAVVACVALVLGAVTLWVWATAQRRWADMRGETLKILHQEMERPSEKLMLRGTPTPGNAWDDYEQALAVTARLPQSDWKRLMTSFRWEEFTVHRDGKPARAKIEAILSGSRSALTHLSQGARRQKAHYRSGGPDGEAHTNLKLNPVWALVHLAGMNARFLAGDGKAREAMEVLLDLGQFSHDLSLAVDRRAAFASRAVLDHFIDELTPLVLSGRLPPEALLEVEQTLELLDRAVRPSSPLEPLELMDFGLEFLESEHLSDKIFLYAAEGLDHEIPRRGAWRFAFSDRLMVADAFFEGAGWARASETVRTASWAEALRMEAGLRQKASLSLNPVVRNHLYEKITWGAAGRQAQARLRLLRIAAHYRATGDFLELDDPFGRQLRRGENACRTKLWSVAWDGVDDGGIGTWRVDTSSIKDIVLEIDR